MYDLIKKRVSRPSARQVAAQPPAVPAADVIAAIGREQADIAAEAMRSTERMRRYGELALSNPEESETYQSRMRAEARHQAKLVKRQREWLMGRLRLWARQDVRKRIAAARAGEPLPPGLAQIAQQQAIKQIRPGSPWDVEREATILATYPNGLA